MLHVTNGDAAANQMREAGIDGEILPWRDVLTDGPVPEGLSFDELRGVRAAFIAGRGWDADDAVARDFAARDEALARFRDHEEVVLWFEHDLYDQLQLLQLLDWFSERPLGATRLTQVASDDYLGPMAHDELRRRFAERAPVTPDQITLGRQGWAAYRAPDPRAVERFIGRGADALAAIPFLRAALRRSLEELPDAHAGLSRTERQALDVAARGPRPLGELYRAAHHEREEAIYLGDSSFADRLAMLGGAETSLVTFDDGTPVDPSAPDAWSRTVVITEAGRAVLAGAEDRVRLLGIDRWLGGVHLLGHEVPWRWDGVRVVV